MPSPSSSQATAIKPFFRVASADAFLEATDERLIDLDHAGRPVAAWPDQRAATCAATSMRFRSSRNRAPACRPMALAPVFWLATHHMARNHVGSGVRVSWKIVPAVTDV
jgi:hypothetical protein